MSWFINFQIWVTNYQVNLLATLVILVIYLLCTRWVIPRVEKNIASTKLKSASAVKGLFVARTLLVLITIAFILLVWGIDFSGLLVLSTSILTLTGVALFASWSLLSNITSFFILLTNVSYKRGNFIRIIDGDNYIEGLISDVGPFATRLITENKEIVLYPNNLILNRPHIVNPRQRWQQFGKIPTHKSE